MVREQCIDCYAACFRERVVLFERVLLTEACRGKGSTLFPSFEMVTTCFVLLCMQLLCALACLYLCILVDENVFINMCAIYI